MPYEDCRIYGPYTREDGRQHICVIRPDGSRTSVSYPKYLMELELGRYLEPHETVDHDDRNINNNAVSNLVVRPRNIHSQLDCRRLVPQEFTCPVCLIKFTLSGKKLSSAIKNRKQKDITGPYCSKSCAGKLSNKSTKVEQEYTNLKAMSR